MFYMIDDVDYLFSILNLGRVQGIQKHAGAGDWT